jgi:predicted PurR-regulated permease PerM
MQNPTHDLTRTTFAVLCLGALIGASLWILLPFIGPGIWAVMLVVATWPLFLRLQGLLWGKRALAVTVMAVALLLLIVAPLTAVVVTIASNVDRIAGWVQWLLAYDVPAVAPDWLAQLPLVGPALAGAWAQAMALGLGGLLPKLAPYAGGLTGWFVKQAGNIGYLVLQFLVMVAVAAVMYAEGESAAAMIRRFVRRLAGERGDNAVTLAGGAIRGVALGVGVTAVVQSLLAGIGLAIVGVPFASLLTALAFMLCIAQVGPFLVLLPAVVWTFLQGDTGWGVFLLVWTLVVGTLDNVLRPILIKRGADLPLLLIFTGVIGGLLAFGLVGIFVGPVVLAVGYTLLEDWMAEADAPPPAA